MLKIRLAEKALIIILPVNSTQLEEMVDVLRYEVHVVIITAGINDISALHKTGHNDEEIIDAIIQWVQNLRLWLTGLFPDSI